MEDLSFGALASQGSGGFGSHQGFGSGSGGMGFTPSSMSVAIILCHGKSSCTFLQVRVFLLWLEAMNTISMRMRAINFDEFDVMATHARALAPLFTSSLASRNYGKGRNDDSACRSRDITVF